MNHDSLDIDLNRGMVKVQLADGINLSDERLKQLFQDAGVTLRSIERQSLE